ncbi:MAG TPA: hypothetical protein VFP47_20090, partial [Pyrinomonadaceae bacterium]|nr:hypothetical protein [Pyrinomonadaceae bacterium]
PSNYESDALPTELSRLKEAFEIYECCICSVKPNKIGPAGGNMPKDATKNIDRYKIRGGQLNEFDFQQNQEQFAEQPSTRGTSLIPGTPPEARVEGLRPVVKSAPAKKSVPAKKSAVKAAKASKKAAKATKKTKATKVRNTAPSRGATPKKLAARKAAKKK